MIINLGLYYVFGLLIMVDRTKEGGRYRPALCNFHVSEP